MSGARRGHSAGGANTARRVRLDRELVRRGLARSRDEAVDLIRDKRVQVDGVRAHKPATEVSVASALVVDSSSDAPRWASRGAHKLVGALDALPELLVADRRCLDAGASAGGFTDVLLHRGAASVVAVDVGYGQLDWRLRTDSRVQVLDRTNIRHLTVADLPEDSVAEPSGGEVNGAGKRDRVDLVVADLSFISLRAVLPALGSLVGDEGDMLLMVKPQFEVGPALVGKGGVVREQSSRTQALLDVAARARELGWGVCGLVTSPLPGPSGNREYFVWLRRDGEILGAERAAEVVAADGSWSRREGAA